LRPKISETTIIRLSVYSRYLTKLDSIGVVTLHAGEIAKGAGVTPSQVRKDFAYFGEFGTRGVGYNVKELQKQILRILSLDVVWSVTLVGIGNLGLALSSYKGFHQRGFVLTSIFDNDSQKIGSNVNGLEVQPMDKLTEVVKKNHTQIGIISVPMDYAQEVADLLVKGGVNAILNFAPIVLNVPPEIHVRNVDLAVNFEVLTYNIFVKS
jgi:redox-sensing transcriptional repressor